LFSSDYLTVDPDLVPKGRELPDAQRQTLSGSLAPRSWFENGTNFQDVKAIDAISAPQPVVAH
jgi:catechol 2,3-dioxygenase